MKPIFVKDLCIQAGDTIHQAVACIDRNARGIALVADAEYHLLGTITDGDIRRAILSGLNMHQPVSVLLERKVDSIYPQPIIALGGMEPGAILELMQSHSVRQIPVLDEARRVVNLITIEELLPQNTLPVTAVVMAGGFGTRLRPLTEDIPKPMLPVGGKPLLEHILGQMRDSGVRHVNITTHYMPEKIVDYFGDGRQFGLEIDYVNEDRPLGTAGALGLMSPPTETMLVINGDILTQINFRAMLKFHHEHQADLTVAVRYYEMQVPYGVLQCDGARVLGVQEKPIYNFLVNAGIYMIEPSAYAFIPHGTKFDMTDLIEKLTSENRTVVSFPIVEYWLDIGHHAQYEQAQKDVKDGRFNGLEQ